MVKMIIGTFVPSIIPHVINCASLNIGSMESSPELRNSCSNVSTIRSSVLFNIVNSTSLMFGDVRQTGTALMSQYRVSQKMFPFFRGNKSLKNVTRKSKNGVMDILTPCPAYQTYMTKFCLALNCRISVWRDLSMASGA